jgi:hypothetical protein
VFSLHVSESLGLAIFYSAINDQVVAFSFIGLTACSKAQWLHWCRPSTYDLPKRFKQKPVM